MKTNFRDLNLHDVAVISMIALGALLLSAEFYISLPEAGQQNVVSALQVFDMRKSVTEDLQGVQVTINLPAEFMGNFYIAATEILIVPEQDIASAKKIVNGYFNFAEQTAVAYQSLYNTPNDLIMNEGRVLGASIDSDPTPAVKEEAEVREELLFPYAFDGSLVEQFNTFSNKLLTYK